MTLATAITISPETVGAHGVRPIQMACARFRWRAPDSDGVRPIQMACARFNSQL